MGRRKRDKKDRVGQEQGESAPCIGEAQPDREKMGGPGGIVDVRRLKVCVKVSELSTDIDGVALTC